MIDFIAFFAGALTVLFVCFALDLPVMIRRRRERERIRGLVRDRSNRN